MILKIYTLVPYESLIISSALAVTEGRGGFLLGGGTGGGGKADTRRADTSDVPEIEGLPDNTILQGPHTRTGFPFSIFPIAALSFEQLSHTIFPQFRQWCLRNNREN